VRGNIVMQDDDIISQPIGKIIEFKETM
jgi:hypothetical protein